MAKKQLIGNREKALLHVAKSQLGMSEEAYREMLESVGVSSSVELDHVRFDAVMDRLKRAGFRPAHKSAKRSGMHKEPPWEKKRMLSKIGAILAELKLPWSYADGIANQMFGIEKVLWCYPDRIYKVLQALIMHQKKQRLQKD